MGCADFGDPTEVSRFSFPLDIFHAFVGAQPHITTGNNRSSINTLAAQAMGFLLVGCDRCVFFLGGAAAGR